MERPPTFATVTEISSHKSHPAFRKRPPHWVTLLIVVALLALGQWFGWSAIGDRAEDEVSQQGGPLADDSLLAEDSYQVDRAVDGDTIIVVAGGQRHRVRLMGIDTPEVFEKTGSGQRLAQPEPFGPEASSFTKQFISGGEVRLRFGRRRLDQYDRLLAYVFVDDRMLNEELARAGLAKAKTYAGDESPLSRRIESAQAEAQQAKRGIWSSH